MDQLFRLIQSTDEPILPLVEVVLLALLQPFGVNESRMP